MPLLAAAAAATVCYARLIAELAGPSGALALTAPGGAPVLAANVSLGALSGYASFSPCASALEVRDAASGALLASAAAAPLANGSRASVFAFGSAADGSAAAALAPDAAGLLPDAVGNIDAAQWRVCNAIDGPGTVSIMGASAECHNCARPRLAQAAYGACSDYMRVDTSWSWNLGLADGQGLQASTTPLSVLPLEHGAYTLVVHNVPRWSADARDVLAFYEDVAGQDAYLPVAWAALALVALSVGVALLSAVAVRYVAVSRDAEAVVAAAAARERGAAADVTLMSFLGADLELAKFLENERKKEGAGGGGGAGGVEVVALGGSLNEGLLEAEGGGAAKAAARPAASGGGTKPRTSGRVVSIDAFRGISLSIMIFVNSGGGGYDRFFDHSRWNGLTVADLVFPWFVWLSGVSMAISFASERRRGASPMQLARRVVWRSLKIYALGLFLNNGTNLSEWRVIGVLPYFAVSNLIVGLLEAFVHPEALSGDAEGGAAASTAGGAGGGKAAAPALPVTLADALRLDVLRYAWQWLLMTILALVYLLTQFYMPLADGCPTGYLGAGGLADNGAFLGKGCTGGAHRAVDVALFGEAHIYHDKHGDGSLVSSATCSDIYRCDVYDPEGALGMLSAAWMAWLGLQAGRVLTTYAHLRNGPGGVKSTLRPFAARWLAWGLLQCLVAGMLCGFSKEDGLIPVNKNLWSPSFVLLLAGFANLQLALWYAVVDVWGFWSGAPFVHAGANSILIYAGSEAFSSYFPFNATPLGDPASHGEHLASNIAGVCSWLIIARFLYLKGFFINL